MRPVAPHPVPKDKPKNLTFWDVFIYLSHSGVIREMACFLDEIILQWTKLNAFNVQGSHYFF